MSLQVQSWSALALLVLSLGLRHGVDADHLAAVDGIARLNAETSPRLARYGGALFALGHGAVVVLVAGLVALGGQRWAPPDWLGHLGAWLAIACLLWLGLANLRALRATPAAQCVSSRGLRSRLLGRWLTVRSPWAALGVGALFALSLDTIAQAAWLAVAAGGQSGLAATLALAALFTLGMLVANLGHSWWLGHVLARADARAARVSRCMAGAVAALSLLMAAAGLLRLLWPDAASWLDRQGLLLALLMPVGLVLVYSLASRPSRDPSRQPSRRQPASGSALQHRQADPV